ncbi:MAG: HNH endonuclease [Dehalococcoidales bacterium]|nr:HNH endonuclease [Dehalococcoidales bacterium]
MGNSLINQPVLVLNQSYEPLAICRARRAIVLVMQGKAEIVENGLGYVRTIGNMIELPSVIRLSQLIRRPHRERKMSRYEIFNRDKYTCQYCGQKSRHLTLDHVIPRYRGGQHTWENVVTACVECNRRKAGRTPKEAGMKLIRPPLPPNGSPLFVIPYHYLTQRNEWQKYLYQ